MSTTSVGTSPAAPRPASAWAASITSAVGLITISTIATPRRTTAAWKKIFEPKRWPSLAPSRMNPETPSEYSTTAVPTVVGGALKLLTIPPMDTGMAETLNDMSAWPMAMTIMGSHGSRRSASAGVVAAAGAGVCVLMALPPPGLALSGLGRRDEQVHPQPLGKEPGDELSLDAVAGPVQRRGKCPQAALARRHGDDPAADPALARQPDVVQPVAGCLIQAGGHHHRQRVMADGGIDHPLFRER